MKNTYELYLIINTHNHKIYIGQTRSDIGYINRFKGHCDSATYDTRHCCKLHNAINKYGKSSFKVIRLMKDVPEDKIDAMECLWIKSLRSNVSSVGYNMTSGGQGIHGYRHTDQTKYKMSVQTSSFWKTLRKDDNLYEQFIKKRSSALRGVPKTKEHRKKLSESRIEYFKTHKNPFLGKHHTQKTKDIISSCNSKPVSMYSTDGVFIREFESAKCATDYLIEIGKTKNKSAFSRILKICHGQDKTAYGFVWKFVKKV